jgi:hypothetical protein
MIANEQDGPAVKRRSEVVEGGAQALPSQALEQYGVRSHGEVKSFSALHLDLR